MHHKLNELEGSEVFEIVSPLQVADFATENTPQEEPLEDIPQIGKDFRLGRRTILKGAESKSAKKRKARAKSEIFETENKEKQENRIVSHGSFYNILFIPFRTNEN
jgi:hypothetical protein